MKFNLTENEFIQILDSSLDSIKNIVYTKENYMEYYNRHNLELIKKYEKKIKESYKTEKKKVNIV